MFLVTQGYGGAAANVLLEGYGAGVVPPTPPAPSTQASGGGGGGGGAYRPHYTARAWNAKRLEDLWRKRTWNREREETEQQHREQQRKQKTKGQAKEKLKLKTKPLHAQYKLKILTPVYRQSFAELAMIDEDLALIESLRRD